MKRILVIAAAFAVAALPAVSSEGFYVGGAFGQTSTDIGGSAPGVSIDDSDTGYKVFGGYSFFQNFAVEAGYVDVGGTSVDFTSPTPSSITTDADGFSFEAVGVLPLGESFDVFAKAGLYMWDATASSTLGGFGTFSGSDDGTDPTYGLGFGWRVSDNGKLRFEADRYELDTIDVDTYSVGYAHSF